MSHVVTEPMNAVNAYLCTDPGCGWRAVTIARAEGETPRFIPCDRNPKHRAETQCHCVDPTWEITHEWYRPTSDEIARKPWLAGYAARGGLLLRPVPVLVCR
jgi:hypothetical protein